MDVNAIQKKIENITGNKPVLEKLYELLDSREAIAFVGAGTSAGLWPLWNEFLEKFVDHSFDLGKITHAEADYFKKDASLNPLETAQQLRNKIGERDYFEFLSETFKDKTSPQTNGAYTQTHEALLKLPIHNYIALNYDAGLTNARAAIYPKATTTYSFWDQEEARHIREKGYKRLILHAHGRHDRADSIILTLNDYRRAYDNRAFVRLLDELFNSENLIFIGFGMTDPYIKQLFNNISKDYKNSLLQHVALVGLDKDEMQVAHLHRERVEMIYGARVLFYPTENHHQALTDWLNMLVEKYSETEGSRKAEEIKPLPAPAQIKQAIEDIYVHKPTDDENFKGRDDVFALINRWANDPDTRTIAITGIGGQGKTAMTGRWLEYERKDNLKNIPVFYWSFYDDFDVPKFLEQVIEFFKPIVAAVIGEIEPISFILNVVQQVRFLLVLDGLEVLQEDANSPNHGNINHPLLNQFIQNWVRNKHKGLMILTSRFHFPQLERYSGVGYHLLDLVRLSTEDGISLLKKLQIYGNDHLLENYVEKLNGHPLALRVLASAVKRACKGDISLCKSEQIIFEGGEGKLYEKIRHLLGFYEKHLKYGQRELLGIVSLFKRPVETQNFIILLGKMKSLKKTPLAKAEKSTIEKQLNLLTDDFLIEKTDEGITTHPVIRDYFRSANKIAGSRKEVADFLQEKPGSKRPQTIEEVRDLVEAAQLLCDEGEFKAAHDLYLARLSEGGYGFNIFKNLPAISEGLECNLAFVGNEERQQKVENILGKSCVAAHFSGVSLYNDYLGNLPQAIEWRYKGIELEKQQYKQIDPGNLNEISIIECEMGKIKKARETLSQALALSHETKDLEDLSTEFSNKAYYEFLLGNSIQAYQDFAIGYLYSQIKYIDQRFLISIWGNQQAEFFIRIESCKQFEAVNNWNIKVCKEYHWNHILAFCHLLQGWYEICQGKFTNAEQALSQAEKILRPSGMLEYTCRLDWVWGLLAEAKGDYQKGLHHVNNALPICADKGFRLRLAEHFILRGRLNLMQFEKENKQNPDLVEKAGDDWHEALKIADDTGHIWAKVDALKLLASYHKTRSQLPDTDKQKEKEFANRYEKEAASIEKGLFLTEEQMEKAKEQARNEFEKQTAGWDKD